MKILRLLLLASVMMLTACQTVVHGHVTAKAIHPAYETIFLMPMSCGKDCTMIIPITMFYPESYSVTVDGVDKKGRAAEDEIYLDQNEYNRTQIGDTYSCGQKIKCVTERPSERR